MSSNSSWIKQTEKLLGTKVIAWQNVGGGCISPAFKLQTASGEEYFLKSSDLETEMFLKEANALFELAKAQAIRVPKVIAADANFLLLEFIQTGYSNESSQIKLGRQFAALHRYQGDQFGFYEDNFIGSNPQKNIPSKTESTNWTEFYFNKRLLFQLELAEENGYATRELIQKFKLLENKIDSILAGSEEAPCLLHGDLWSGNFLIDSDSNPVLIDPAVYYGHREADLAMTCLFGRFDPVFYSAYQEAYPLPDGWQYRENIYKLYHVLNHLNLFGRGYYNQAISLINSYI